jgi:hypothetical protein
MDTNPPDLARGSALEHFRWWPWPSEVRKTTLSLGRRCISSWLCEREGGRGCVWIEDGRDRMEVYLYIFETTGRGK